ncbi:MAG: tetratricopeptide repeat protein [Spirochaetales bacterium]|nr:tetratricopeptide repeat protein [Spirochaetales bacterium]
MKIRIRVLPLLLLAAAVIPVLWGCSLVKEKVSSPYRYFIVGNDTQRQKLEELFHRQETSAQTPEEHYIIIYQIIKILHSQNALERLNVFLSTYVEQHIDDPFNAYYLLVVADNYKLRGAYPVAVMYYERLLKNYGDLLVQGHSVHMRSLENLIRMVKEPSIKINYYKDILARFPDKVDQGPIYYYLAKTYEELGDWDLSIQAYKKFLSFPDAKIDGAPDAKDDITKMVAYYDRKDKDWVWENLDDLVSGIKSAIWQRNANRLLGYRSGVNFFAQVWAASDPSDQQEITPDDFISDIDIFLRSRVHFSRTLDTSSNSREAYLKTWGWSHRISSWYLYFRRVDFPADPEIHGRWEWGGIYFGDKPFSASADS